MYKICRSMNRWRSISILFLNTSSMCFNTFNPLMLKFYYSLWIEYFLLSGKQSIQPSIPKYFGNTHHSNTSPHQPPIWGRLSNTSRNKQPSLITTPAYQISPIKRPDLSRPEILWKRAINFGPAVSRLFTIKKKERGERNYQSFTGPHVSS